MRHVPEEWEPDIFEMFQSRPGGVRHLDSEKLLGGCMTTIGFNPRRA